MTSPTWAAAVVDDEIAASAVRKLAQRRPDVVALARVTSVAAIVEPALLRRLRLEVPGLAPKGGSLDAGVEADLWFSRLAHVATAGQLTLRPAVAEILRHQLREPQHGAMGRAARKIVADAHHKHPDMVQLEERIIWSTIIGDADDVGRAFDRALTTIRLGPDRAAEVIRWLMQARRRLPASALDTPAGSKLLAAVAMHVDRIIPAELLTVGQFPDSVGDVAPTGLPVTTVAVELAEGGVRFVASDQPNAAIVTVPDTRPLVMEARWTGEDGVEHSAVILAEPGSATTLDGLAGRVILRTIAGRRFLVYSSTFVAHPEREVPSLERACVLVANAGGLNASGYFVAPNLIATTSQLGSGTQSSAYRVRWEGRWLAATLVSLERAVMVLRLSQMQQDAAVLTLGPLVAQAQDGDTWITLGFAQEAEEGERLAGTVVSGQFMLARTTVLQGLAGAPVIVRGELAGQVSNITWGATPSEMAVVEVVVTDEIRRAVDAALLGSEAEPTPVVVEDIPHEPRWIQTRLILQNHPGAAAYPAPAQWDDVDNVAYLYREYALLVREPDAERVAAALRRVLDDTGYGDVPEGDAREIRGEEVSRGLVRLSVPRTPTPSLVPYLVDRLDEALGPGVATPEHVLYLCPAADPEEVPDGLPPNPGVSRESRDGDGARVVVLDSGLLPAEARQHHWLDGVAGSPEDPHAADASGDMVIVPYAGHGTFAAGVLRCMAPRASVHVERAFDIAGADYETRLVASLEAALARNPDILVLTFSSSTHRDQSLRTFDDLYEQRIRQMRGLVVLAQATTVGHARCGRPPSPGPYP